MLALKDDSHFCDTPSLTITFLLLALLVSVMSLSELLQPLSAFLSEIKKHGIDKLVSQHH